jgi:hypothetical protein
VCDLADRYFPRARQFQEPVIKCRALGRIQRIERDTHSKSMLGIHNGTASVELSFILVDGNLHLSAHWKRNHGVNKASPGPKVRRAR